MNPGVSDDGRNWASTDPDAPAVRAAVRSVRSGDREAFGQIVELYQRRLFGLGLMMTRDSSGAEEIAQDAFVRAFANLNSYDDSRPFYPWLATIAVRLAQNWLVRRRRINAREPVQLDAGRTAPSAGVDPLAALIADETDAQLWRAVARLASGERTAAILYYRQEMSVRDIAGALGVTNGTVKTLLFRARHRLRRAMAATSPGEDTP